MTERIEEVLSAALTLPPRERAEVAERLLASLKLSLHETDQLWGEEAESRIDAFERGEIQAAPAEAVFQRIECRKKL